ncbi:MAG: hypothetical protein OCC49_10975 [Fibrobacterales bacterium]
MAYRTTLIFFFLTVLVYSKGITKDCKTVNNKEICKVYKNKILRKVTEYTISENTGIETTYHENGKLKSKFKMVKGQFIDTMFVYHENGNLESSSPFINGEENGFVKYWYSNGQLKIINNYDDGKKDGEYKKFFENGVLKEKGQFVKKRRNGIFTEFWPNKHKKMITEYKMNQPLVEERFFRISGRNQKTTFIKKRKIDTFTSYTKPGKVYFSVTDLKKGYIKFLDPVTEECVAHKIKRYRRIEEDLKCSDVTG